MPAFDLASQPATMAEHELVGTMSGMEKRRGLRTLKIGSCQVGISYWYMVN